MGKDRIDGIRKKHRTFRRGDLGENEIRSTIFILSTIIVLFSKNDGDRYEIIFFYQFDPNRTDMICKFFLISIQTNSWNDYSCETKRYQTYWSFTHFHYWPIIGTYAKFQFFFSMIVDNSVWFSSSIILLPYENVYNCKAQSLWRWSFCLLYKSVRMIDDFYFYFIHSIGYYYIIWKNSTNLNPDLRWTLHRFF